MCNVHVRSCMRNTEPVTKTETARSVWLARPQSDRDAWNNFRKAATTLIGHVDADLQQHLKLGYTDVDALLHLSNADNRCLRMATLARGVSRSPSALTRLVDRLVDRSLVTRTRHSSTDVNVEITPQGVDVLAQAAPRIIDQVDERFWSRLTEDELITLSRICRKLMDTEPINC